MSDTQSRYGIVSEITEKKKELVSEKQRIREELNAEIFKHKRMGEDIEAFKKTVAAKIIALDDMIKGYDQAIDAVKSISKEQAGGE